MSLDGLQYLQERVRSIAKLVTRANRCGARTRFPGSDYPPTINDPHCWDLARKVAEELLGEGRAKETPPVMAGEDFAFYLQRIPGCFVYIGVRNEEAGSTHGLHHPRFKVDENALPIGAALHASFAIESLKELASSG